MKAKISLIPKNVLLGGVTFLVLVSIFVWIQRTATAASPLALPQEVLEEKAIVEAEVAGLQGAPTAKKAVQMTLGEWLELNDAELGKDAAKLGLSLDIPVFVLAIRGNVESRIPSPPKPGQTEPEQYDNITIVLNAVTGELMWTSATSEGFSMPVPVP